MVTGEPLKIRPSKTVAGHEADKTNEFLQALGKAIALSVCQNKCLRRHCEFAMDTNDIVPFLFFLSTFRIIIRYLVKLLKQTHQPKIRPRKQRKGILVLTENQITKRNSL